MVIGAVLVIALALIFTRSDNDTTTETANENTITETEQQPEPVPTPDPQPTPTPTPSPTPDPQPQPTRNPNPNHNLRRNPNHNPAFCRTTGTALTDAQKNSLNPFDCDHETEWVRADNGQCVVKSDNVENYPGIPVTISAFIHETLNELCAEIPKTTASPALNITKTTLTCEPAEESILCERWRFGR